MSYINGKKNIYIEGDKGDIRSIKHISEIPHGGKDGAGVEGRNYIVGNASFDGMENAKHI